MKRSTHTEVAQGSGTRPSNVSPYPRALMICGAALIGYGVIASAFALFRTVTLAGNTIAVRSAARHDSTKEMKSRETQPTRAAISPSLEEKSQGEIMQMYAQWKIAWTKRDFDGILKLYSRRAEFRIDPQARLQGYEDMKTSLRGLLQAGYSVVDEETPNLFIEGDYATLIVAQVYARSAQSVGGLNTTHRFVLKHEPAESNNPLPSKRRQWRIIKSEYIRPSVEIY